MFKNIDRSNGGGVRDTTTLGQISFIFLQFFGKNVDKWWVDAPRLGNPESSTES